MGLFQLPVSIPATEGVIPQIKFVVTTDGGAKIQTLNYLNFEVLEGFGVKRSDIIQMFYNYNSQNNAGVPGQYIVNYVSGQILLEKLFANLVWYDITLTAAALANAGKVIVQYPNPQQAFIIRDLRVDYSAAGLSGGGGDRLVALTDGTTVFNGSGITAALLGTPVNTVWGGTGNPLPSTTSMIAGTQANSTLYFQYTGGTTDYTTGSVTVSVLIERLSTN